MMRYEGIEVRKREQEGETLKGKNGREERKRERG